MKANYQTRYSTKDIKICKVCIIMDMKGVEVVTYNKNNTRNNCEQNIISQYI